VIDKPGKGSFHGTSFGELLQERGITSLIVTGVTTEVCVHTTVREANDRGYECLVLSDCVGSYFPEFQQTGLAMIAAQGGIFGWVAPSSEFLAVLSDSESTAPPGGRHDPTTERRAPLPGGSQATPTPSSVSASTPGERARAVGPVPGRGAHPGQRCSARSCRRWACSC
jgi:hypothetical protein